MRGSPGPRTPPYSIGPPRGRRGQTGAFLAACGATAAILLLLGWLVLGWRQWRDFMSAACITVAGLLLTVSVVEIGLDYQRRLRARPLRDELLRRMLRVVVDIVGDIAVVIGQTAVITNKPTKKLVESVDSIYLHLGTLFMTRIPRAGSSVPQAELEAYIQWGSEVSELVRPMAQKISSQIVPLLAALDEDAELLRLSLALAAVADGELHPQLRKSASEALAFLTRLAQSAGNVLARLRALYEQDPAWRTVFEEGDIVVWGYLSRPRPAWPGVMGPTDPPPSDRSSPA